MSNESMTALVTGAGSGIGRATAVGLAKLGAPGRPGGSGRREARRDPEARRARTTRWSSPATWPTGPGVDAMAGRVLAAFGGSIDVLVCNAGTNVRDRSLAKLSPDDWDKMIDTNLTGAFNLVHAFLPAMRAQGQRPDRPGLLDRRASRQPARRGGLFGLEVRPGGARDRDRPRGRAPRHPLVGDLPGRGEHADPRRPPRPRPPGAEGRDPPARGRRRGRLLPRPAPPRANIPELVIKPTVDDWA